MVTPLNRARTVTARNPQGEPMQLVLDDFTVAYIEAALWSSSDESTPNGGEPLDRNYGLEDIEPATLSEMMTDCTLFYSENREQIESAGYRSNEEYGPAAMAGHDFWLTRNGHGTGFWDRDLGDVGDDLTDEAHAWGNYSLYVGDDGLIYGMNG